MKKFFSFFAAVLFAGSMMADVVTLDPATQTPQTTETDINITVNGIGVAYHGTLNAAAEVNGQQQPADFRVFASQTLKLSSATNKIEKVVIAGYCKKGFTLSADKGTVSTGASYADETTKAELTDPLIVVENIGNNSVTLTCGKQIRAYKIEVTLGEASEGGDPVVVTPADTLTCAQAAEQALAGKTDEVIIKGYVTEMVEEWSSFKNVSFWMSDTKGGANTFEAFRVKCETAAEAPTPGALVWVKGKLTKYTKNGTDIPETTQGGTFGILAKGEEVAPPQNLGAKTIAEFLQLKNKRDTCILTGVVANIVSTEYGNFDLCDENDTVYVYGLLTAAGESKKFASLGVVAGDTLTLKAIYNEYNGNPQVKNGIFVSVKKAPVVKIEVTITEGVVFTDAVEAEGWWQISGENDDYYVSLSNGNEVTKVAGKYTVDDLDAEYSFIYDYAIEDYIDLVSGSVEVVVADNGDVGVDGEFVGSDGNTYVLGIVYTEPTAKTTKNLVCEGVYEIDDEGDLELYGEAADGSNVTLVIAGASDVVGEFTEEDLYFEYGIVADAETEKEVYIYKATIKIEAADEGLYTLTADLLCYNNTLYKVTMTLEEYVEDALDNTTAASKFMKAIQNGTVVIEKNNALYNINGQTIR